MENFRLWPHFRILSNLSTYVLQLTVVATGFFGVGDVCGQQQPHAIEAFKNAKEMLVGYAPGQSESVTVACEQLGIDVIQQYPQGHFLICRWKELAVETVEALKQTPNVRYVEPNYPLSIPQPPQGNNQQARETGDFRDKRSISHGTATGCIPNDPEFAKLWGMKNIHAPEAWCCIQGSRVLVAVIDTGVDYTHEDLKKNMWKNPGEIPADGIDNDGNGLVDDVFGFDYANSDSDPMDDNRHGTHCAGTIGAVGNNGIGVVGVNWYAKIMALKFLSAAGSGSTSNAIRCIDYARIMGAKVMSNSWGGGGFSQALADAISRAEQAGILFIAAAGNSASDNDISPHYPSSYPNQNIIAVASINRMDELSWFSCFGKSSVDLAAPGGTASGVKEDDILSTIPNNQYDFLAGTSMATPHVSGAAVLLMAHPCSQGVPWQSIKNLLLSHARPRPSLQGKCVTGGTLDIRFINH